MPDPRVRGAEIWQLEYPPSRPMRSGIHEISAIHVVAVRLHVGEVTGVGYAYGFSAAHMSAVRELVVDRAKWLVGRDSDDVRETHSEMLSWANFVGRSGIAMMAIASLDTALWDARARMRAVPLSRFLGGVPRPRRMYGSGGSLDMSEEELVEEALRYRGRGYAGYKMRVGGEDPEIDLARVRLVQGEVGPGFFVAVDANQAWSRDTARDVMERLRGSGLAWVEEPLDAEDVAGLAWLRARSELRIAAGETVYGEPGHGCLLEAAAVDVLQPDLMRCGGVTGLLKVVALAAFRRIPVSPHLFTEMSASLLAAMPRPGLVEHLDGWFEPLFSEAPRKVDGCVSAGDEPGFGLTFRVETLRNCASSSVSI